MQKMVVVDSWMSMYLMVLYGSAGIEPSLRCEYNRPLPGTCSVHGELFDEDRVTLDAVFH